MNAPLIIAPLKHRVSNGGKTAKGNSLILCPHCDAPCTIRHSERVTETVKHLICQCSNSSGCGATFLSEIVFVHFFNPGLVERPDLDLPVCPRDRAPHIFPPDKGNEESEQISMFSG